MIATSERFDHKSRANNGQHVVNESVRPNGRRLRRRLVAAATLVVALAFAWMYGLPWANYRLAHVVTHEAVIVGDITPIGARIDGKIAHLEVEPGQRVRQGDLLARFEDQHLRSRVNEAQANVDRSIDEHSAQRVYIDQQRKLLELQVERVAADVERAVARLAEVESEQLRWEKEFERTAPLVSSRSVSQSHMDQIRSYRDATRAKFEAAKASQRAAELEYSRAQLDLEGMVVDESRLNVLASKIEVARCELATARADLESASIRAPQNGRVVRTIVGPGASVKVGQPILTFWEDDRFRVEARVDETALSQFDIGTPADVTLPAYRGEVFAGRVQAICPVANNVEQASGGPASPLLPNSNQFCVWISLDDVDRPLVPGLSAIVGIDRRPDPVRSVEPADAMQIIANFSAEHHKIAKADRSEAIRSVRPKRSSVDLLHTTVGRLTPRRP